MHLFLDNQVAFVSGSTKGIGKAIAYALAKEGCRVFINGRDGSSVLELVDTWNKEGLKVYPAICDVSEKEQVENTISSILSNHECINILVNNVGIYDFKPLEEITAEEWDYHMKINWRSTFLLSKEVLPSMKKYQGGRIINISSVRGFSGRADGAPYNVAKGGLLSFTQGLAREAGPFNITSNAIAPGYILTEGMKEIADKRGLELENLKHLSPLNRIGDPEDVANFVLFLASPLSKFITGQVFVIDGGAFI